MTSQKTPFSLADLFNLKYPQAARLSPDGRWVVCAVNEIDAKAEQDYTSLWLVAVETGEIRKLTNGLVNDTSPEWSPDSRHIAFSSDRGGISQIYIIPIDGGEARQITDLPQGVESGPIWSPDGKRITFSAVPEQKKIDLQKPYRVTRKVYRFDGIGFLDSLQLNLFEISIETGECHQLTQNEEYAIPVAWSPDGMKLLYTNHYMKESFTYIPDLKVLDEQGCSKILLSNWRGLHCPVWLPDSQRIAFLGIPEGHPIGDKQDLWIYSLNGGFLENRTPSLDKAIGEYLQPDMPFGMLFAAHTGIDKEGKWGFTWIQDGGNLNIYRIALNGKESWSPILTGERALLPHDLQQVKLLCFVSDPNHPGNWITVNLDGSDECQITHFNEEIIDQRILPKIQHLEFKSEDGTPVEGWLMLPTTASKPPYPTILSIHGGPWSGWGNIFNFDFQMFSGAGYGVLYINPRGSTGYGTKFTFDIHANWGGPDYADCLAAVDYAIDQGLTDPDRLGVCGISYGGYMSCWIIGHTDRFKAAAPENPVTNWFSFYGVSGEGGDTAVASLGGRPWEIPDVYMRCSPITYAHNCKTPTLLIQGETDYCCPAEQSEQFYTVLKDIGCKVEMLRLPDSSHTGAMDGSAIVRMVESRALLEWMDQYVLGKETIQ